MLIQALISIHPNLYSLASREGDVDGSSGWALDCHSGGLDTVGLIGNQLDNRVNRGLSDFDTTHRFVTG